MARLAWLIVLAAAAYYPLRRLVAGGVASPEALAKPLAGQTWVVTGGAAGIGFETALQLARQNASVVIATRNATRAAGAVGAIRAAVPHADVTAMDLDLGSLASVRSFAAELLAARPRLDGLIANAGVMMNPELRTADGFELHMGTNHLGHFLLVSLLEGRLKASAPSRIVLVSSRAADHGAIDTDDLNWEKRSPIVAYQAYADSKLANAVHARELARRLAGTGVTAVSLHPGLVNSQLFRHVPVLGRFAPTLLAPLLHLVMKTPWEGAQTVLHAALDDSVPAHAGAYFADAAVAVLDNAQATDDALAARLWAVSERLVGLAPAPAAEAAPVATGDAAPAADAAAPEATKKPKKKAKKAKKSEAPAPTPVVYHGVAEPISFDDAAALEAAGIAAPLGGGAASEPAVVPAPAPAAVEVPVAAVPEPVAVEATQEPTPEPTPEATPEPTKKKKSKKKKATPTPIATPVVIHGVAEPIGMM